MLKYCYMILLSVLAFTLVSCNDDDDAQKYPDQLFRPASFKADVQNGYVVLTWVPISGATYLIEVSKDDHLYETELQRIELEEGNSYTLDNLVSGAFYSARIKSVSTNSSIKDSEYAELTFTAR